MRFDDEFAPVQRRPGLGAVVFVSFLVSVVCSAATVFAVLKFGLIPLAPVAVDSEELVKVPELSGLTEAQVRDKLQGAGLRLLRGADIEDLKAKPGLVVKQEPRAGSELKSGGAVEVSFAIAAKRVVVPKVGGLKQEEAQAALREAGLKVVQVQPGGEGDPGTVSGITPKEGSEVLAGSEVVLIVVAEPDLVKVPRVVRMTKHRARKTLEEAGLELGKVRSDYYDSLPEGRVVDQSPSIGAEVPKGSEVNITVND